MPSANTPYSASPYHSTNHYRGYRSRLSYVARSVLPISLLLTFLGCHSTRPLPDDSTVAALDIGRHPKRQASGNLQLADPTMTYFQGKYYLYGTAGDKTVNDGFRVYTSSDLRHWNPAQDNGDTSNGWVLQKGNSFGTRGFWAPQVFLYQHRWIMAYTANEQIALAYNDRGPGDAFSQTRPFQPLFHDGFKHIDPFVFHDGDNYYIYYVKLDKGNKIYVSELGQNRDKDILGPVVKGTERRCIEASQGWENTASSDWPVTEGPTVLKHKATYYLLYSANDFRNPDYAVGYATASTPLGPWKKFMQNPILSRKQTGLNGTGHGDVFKDKKGDFYYVFHVHHTNRIVGPRKTMLIPFHFKAHRGGPDQIVMDDQKLLAVGSSRGRMIGVIAY